MTNFVGKYEPVRAASADIRFLVAMDVGKLDCPVILGVGLPEPVVGVFAANYGAYTSCTGLPPIGICGLSDPMTPFQPQAPPAVRSTVRFEAP